MVFYENIPEPILRRKHLWESKKLEWLEKVTKEEEFYYNDVEGTGTLFTVQQLEKIKDKTGIPINLNFIYPIINQKLAIIMNSTPSFKVMTLDGRNKEYAYILDKAIRHILYKSESIGEEEEIIKNMLVLGMGISGLFEEPEYQFGTFNISYQNIHPSYITLDCNARKRNLKDMEGYFYDKEISIEEAKRHYQKYIDEINALNLAGREIKIEDLTTPMSKSYSKTNRVDDGFDKTISLSIYYDKVYTTMYFVEDIGTGDIYRIFEENLSPDTMGILELAIEKEENLFVRQHIMLGDKLIAMKIMPIKDFPIKVKFFEWGGKPYKSYGMPHFIISMQETLDKAIQLLIHNGMIQNNAGYLVPKDGILPEDETKWENLGNVIGAIKYYNPVVIENQVLVPQREVIQPMSNFYPTIIHMMREGMEYSTGINPVVHGNPNESKIEVFSTVKQYQNAAMYRIQLAIQHIHLANQQLANVAIDMLLANLLPNINYVFFSQETGNIDELKVASEIVRDFKLSRYIVLGESTESTMLQRQAMATELMKISQTTADPLERELYIKKAFELSDLRGFDELAEQLDTAKKLQSQIIQLQDQVERDKELIKQYENRALIAEYNEKLAKLLVQAQVNVSKAEVATEKDLQIDMLKKATKEKNTK